MKKIILLFISILFVYGWYFFAHVQKEYPQQSVLGVQSHILLIKEPEDGIQPMLTALNTAIKTIDVEVYLLSEKSIIASLKSACERGVAVRVLLEEHPFGGGTINQKTKEKLDSSCVKAQWTNPAFALTHEKTIVVDNALVFILNQNLTAASFTKNREYNIEDGNLSDVQEVERIFVADWTRSSFQQTNSNLVISPLSSRSMLESLIRSASSTLFIEMEVIDDPEVQSLLIEKAKTIPVRIILPSLTKVSSNKDIAKKLADAGVTIHFLNNPYLHAKLILTDEKKAYIGSINLTTQSMDTNREVGIMVSQQDILTNLSASFLSDWDTTGAN